MFRAESGMAAASRKTARQVAAKWIRHSSAVAAAFPDRIMIAATVRARPAPKDGQLSETLADQPFLNEHCAASPDIPA